MKGKNPNQVSMYLTPVDRAAAEDLLLRLIEQGHNLTDQKGNPSLSALFRFLVKRWQDRIEENFFNQDPGITQ